MRFCSLGSGSKGNGTIVQYGKTTLLIDSGFTLKDIEFRLAKKGLTALDLTAILVTHEHSDHIKGVGPLARKYRIPVYLSHGTSQHEGLGKISSLKIIDSHDDFDIGEINVQPVVVPHDAREPTQFVLKADGLKLGILTDLGSFTPYIISQYESVDALMLETNHDIAMLRSGPYPPKLKVRVEGHLGHLNNEQAGHFLTKLNSKKLQFLVATHISGQNNHTKIALDSLYRNIDRESGWIIMADQANGFDWCQIA